MKVKLPTVESQKQFNIRLPESLRAELTQLRERCEGEHLDFNAAITSTLRAFAVSLRAELSNRKPRAASRSASENGAPPLADSLQNGAITVTGRDYR